MKKLVFALVLIFESSCLLYSNANYHANPFATSPAGKTSLLASDPSLWRSLYMDGTKASKEQMDEMISRVSEIPIADLLFLASKTIGLTPQQRRNLPSNGTTWTDGTQPWGP